MNQRRSFFDVPTVRVRTSVGEAELPLKYEDASALFAYFAVDPDRVAPLVDRRLRPLRVRGGRAIAVVTWFEYRKTSIGPYNELSIAVLVSTAPRSPRFPVVRILRGDDRVGAHILHLPVTTEVACAAGRELFGYPKIVADIPMDFTRGQFEGELAVNGVRIFAMQAPCKRGFDVRAPDITTFSQLEGHLMRTHVATDCRLSLHSGGGVRVTIDDTDHEIARTLRTLEIGKTSASMVLYANPFRSLLPLGEIVRARGARAA